MVTKTCIGCRMELDTETSFYRAGNTWQSRCKACHNSKRNEYYVRKPSTEHQRAVRRERYRRNHPKVENAPRKPIGLDNVSEDVKLQLKQLVADGKVSLTKISREVGLPYHSMVYWRKTGRLIPYGIHPNNPHRDGIETRTTTANAIPVKPLEDLS